jgi:hypothetical protein
MTDEPNNSKPNTLAENLGAVGQIIVGELESLGGIITGDPVTRAEGDFNVEAGNIHQETLLESEPETPDTDE